MRCTAAFTAVPTLVRKMPAVKLVSFFEKLYLQVRTAKIKTAAFLNRELSSQKHNNSSIGVGDERVDGALDETVGCLKIRAVSRELVLSVDVNRDHCNSTSSAQGPTFVKVLLLP